MCHKAFQSLQRDWIVGYDRGLRSCLLQLYVTFPYACSYPQIPRALAFEESLDTAISHATIMTKHILIKVGPYLCRLNRKITMPDTVQVHTNNMRKYFIFGLTSSKQFNFYQPFL